VQLVYDLLRWLDRLFCIVVNFLVVEDLLFSIILVEE
jgi:hypothetical protein